MIIKKSPSIEERADIFKLSTVLLSPEESSETNLNRSVARKRDKRGGFDRGIGSLEVKAL